ncbi:MAG: LptF/LptG family permease [Planctomycetota bacterium]
MILLRLHRHVLVDLLWNFAFAVAVISGTFVIVMMLDLMFRIEGSSLLLILRAAPALLVQAMGIAVIPIAVLVSVISTFGRLSQDGEITILKASGIHPFQTMPPALFMGVACACVTLYINDELVPRADLMRKTLLNEADIVKMLRTRVEQSNRTFSMQDWDLVWESEEFPPGLIMKLNKVTARERARSGGGEGGKFIAAASAELKVDSERLLTITLKEAQSLKGQTVSAEEATLPVALGDTTRPMHLQHRTGTELFALAKRISRQGHPWILLSEVLAELHGRLALAMACVVFVILGAPLAIVFRAANRLIAFTMACLGFLFCYLSMFLGRSLASRGLLDPGIAMWSGNVLLSALGLTLLLFVVRR